MGQQREPSVGTLTSMISGVVIGAAGLAWWLLSEAENRQRSRKHRAMLYAPRMQDGSEALEASNAPRSNEQLLEHRVEQLNSQIADVRRQLEDLGART